VDITFYTAKLNLSMSYCRIKIWLNEQPWKNYTVFLKMTEGAIGLK